MKKESEAKVKVGDRICIVNPINTHGNYGNGNKGEITNVDEKGAMVFFDHYEEGSGSMYVFNEEFEVITTDESKTAEYLRNSILDIRSKREALQKEILQLDEQEKGAVEKLKELGFILYEYSVSKEVVATERKAELYAEDIEEDMTDPKNWWVGDIVECIKKEWITFEEFNIGAKYEIVKIDIGSDGVWVSLVDAAGDLMAVPCKEFKFHSRPVK